MNATGESEELHTEIYEIDYRGPETHSSGVPPPHHFHIGKQHSTSHPQKGSVRGTKALGLRDSTYDENKASFFFFFFYFSKLFECLSLLQSTQLFIHLDLKTIWQYNFKDFKNIGI